MFSARRQGLLIKERATATVRRNPEQISSRLLQGARDAIRCNRSPTGSCEIRKYSYFQGDFGLMASM